MHPFNTTLIKAFKVTLLPHTAIDGSAFSSSEDMVYH